MTTAMTDYQELATRVLAAMAEREDSYVRDNHEGSDSYAVMGPLGHYELNYDQAAGRHARDENEQYLITMLMVTCWNDVQEWAKNILEENKKTS